MQTAGRLLRQPLLTGAARLLFTQNQDAAGYLTPRTYYSGAGSTASGGHVFVSQQQAWMGAGGALGLGAAASLMLTRAEAEAPQDAPSTTSAAAEEVKVDFYARPATLWGGLPKTTTLYQYAVCPYCCKVRATLDYYKVPYEVVEVNPLTKKELKALDQGFKKVPVLQVGESFLTESSVIMSRLAAEAELPAASSNPSSASSSSSSSGNSTAAVKKAGWFAGKAAGASTAASVSSGSFSEEETRWRKWVDDRFVKLITANIYRNWGESLNTFEYIVDQTNWGWGTREAARWSGAIIMWRVGKGLPKKYGIEGDLREALYSDCNEFVDAVGARDFLGGARPNLGDLAVFGVLRAVAQTPAFKDAMAHSRVAPWYHRMEAAVGPCSALP